ncbi:MAG: leucine-rich repeat protein [Lachnospiraceae bacterium]|nr:leucine-rich repeat protein [Lachnospiraceae bacterium]
MEKRQENLLRKVMAVLLSAVLLIGTVSGAKPLEAEAADYQLPVSGNGWTLSTEGVLTIDSQAGMESWRSAHEREEDHGSTIHISKYADDVKQVIINSGVTAVTDYAFYECNNMTSVTLPNGLETIGDYAFAQCANMESVNLPEGLKTIGEYAFEKCSQLKNIDIPETVETIKKFAFESAVGITEMKIPDSVNVIEEGIFSDMVNLQRVRLSGNITNIPDHTFMRCKVLETVTVSDDFENASGVVLPENIQTIGTLAFGACSKIKEITIPKTVTNIGSNAFYDCGELEKVIMQGEEPPECHNADKEESISYRDVFYNCSFIKQSEKAIIVPKGCAQKYKAAWPKYEKWIAEEGKEDFSTLRLVVTVLGYEETDSGNLGEVKLESGEGDKSWSPALLAKAGKFIYEVTEELPLTEYDWVINGKSVLDSPVILSNEGEEIESTVTFCTVRFKDGEELIDTKYVKQNTAVEAPADSPVKDGYTFAGWVTEEDRNTSFDFGQEITDATTVYASWTENHTHTPKEEWNRDAENHWHDCVGEDGIKLGAEEHHFGDWIVDTEATEETEGARHRECTVCHYREDGTIPKKDHTHTPKAEWNKDANSHWHDCVGEDGIKLDTAGHSFGGWIVDIEATEETEGARHRNCTVCGYTENGTIPKVPKKEQHVHSPSGAWSRDANTHWRDCILGDARLDMAVHSFGEEWKYNETEHWNECFCGEKSGPVAHTEDDGTVTKAPTSVETGIITYRCTVCGYEIRTEVIPASGTGEAPKDNTGETPKDNTGENEKTQEKDSEPKTGGTVTAGPYATLGMVAGLGYLHMYFEDCKSGMTEEKKKEIKALLLRWARGGGYFRRMLAFAAFFLLLVYYYGICKNTIPERETGNMGGNREPKL